MMLAMSPPYRRAQGSDAMAHCPFPLPAANLDCFQTALSAYLHWFCAHRLIAFLNNCNTRRTAESPDGKMTGQCDSVLTSNICQCTTRLTTVLSCLRFRTQPHHNVPSFSRGGSRPTPQRPADHLDRFVGFDACIRRVKDEVSVVEGC